MKVIDLLHRWTGGLIGLLLAALGLSGAILVYKDSLVMLPHARDAQIRDIGVLSDTITRLTANPENRPDTIQLASQDFGLHRLRLGGEAGAYTDQSGNIIAQWSSKWERVELWLFDFHHYLWAGETGEIVAGWLALIGIGFVVTGIILWWPLRKTFQFRLWPARMSRPAIVRQHRDLGIVLSPILFLSLLTGVMMTLQPVANILLNPWSSAEDMKAATARPKVKGGPLADNPDWAAMLAEAQRVFPDAELRRVQLPKKPGDLITLRIKQPDEWAPNGRTFLWFDPADGRLMQANDALAAPTGSQISNAVFPVHAAKVGGLAYKLAITASGLTLAMLGTLTVWSFWFRRPRRNRAVMPRITAVA